MSIELMWKLNKDKTRYFELNLDFKFESIKFVSIFILNLLFSNNKNPSNNTTMLLSQSVIWDNQKMTP